MGSLKRPTHIDSFELDAKEAGSLSVGSDRMTRSRDSDRQCHVRHVSYKVYFPDFRLFNFPNCRSSVFLNVRMSELSNVRKSSLRIKAPFQVPSKFD